MPLGVSVSLIGDPARVSGWIGAGLLHFDEHVSRPGMGIPEDIGRAQHRTDGDALAQRGDDTSAVVRSPVHVPDHLADGVGPGHPARGVAAVALVVDPRRPPDGPAQRGPLFVGGGGDGHRPAPGGKDLEGAEPRVGVTRRAGDGAACRVVVDDRFAQGEDAVVHRHVEELAGAAAGDAVQRRNHAEGGQGAGGRCRPPRGRPAPPGRPSSPVVPTHAAHALSHDVEGGPVAVGALAGARVAEAAHRGVDQGGPAGAQGFVAEADALHDPGAKVLDQGIGAVDQPQRHAAVPLVAQVEDDAALVAVDAGKVATVVAALPIRGEGAEPPGEVALRGLHLDHVGTEVGEEHGAKGPRQGPGQIEDGGARERAGGGRHTARPRGA